MLLLIGAAATAPAAAQEPDTTVLDPVVVTATRLPTPRSSVVSTVSIIEGDDLRLQGVGTVAEALRMVAGLSVAESGSWGSATSLFMRGGESDYVKVLVDGVPVNQPGGAYDFAGLTLDNIERVEIVRGPASVLYGSDAVAGVVQVFTKRGYGRTEVEAGVSGGTHGSLNVDAYASGGTDEIGFSVGVMKSATDGLHEYNSDYDNLVLSAALTAQPDTRTEAILTARYGDSEYHFPTDAAGQVTDMNAFQTRGRFTTSLELSRFVTRAVEARALLALNRATGGMDDRADDHADTVGFFGYLSDGTVARRSLDLRANVYLSPAAVFTGGAQIERQTERSAGETLSEFGSFFDSLDVARTNRSYYAQLQLEPARGAAVNGGVRLDDNETFGTFLTYRVGATYRLCTGSLVRGSLGRAFKEPTFYENFANTPFAVGNPDLDPERSLTWELGIEQRVGAKLVLVGTYFDQKYEDLIQYNAVVEPGDPNYVNVAAAASSGVEIEARTAESYPFGLRASYTYLRTEVTDAGLDTGPDVGFVEGERLLRRPVHRGTLNAQYGRSGLGLVAVNFDYVGDRSDRDFSVFPAERVVLPHYVRVDLAGELTVLRSVPSRTSVTITARVENVLDGEHQEVVGFPARGRVILVGARLGN
jgi:vitamin B12 transporter